MNLKDYEDWKLRGRALLDREDAEMRDRLAALPTENLRRLVAALDDAGPNSILDFDPLSLRLVHDLAMLSLMDHFLRRLDAEEPPR